MTNKKALVVGGSNGIGLAITHKLLEKYQTVYIIDKNDPDPSLTNKSVIYKKQNLISDDLSCLNDITDIDTLVITAGFGRVSYFENLVDAEIVNSFKVNTISVIRIIKHYYTQIKSDHDFNCAVMCSIAGLVSSPLFSIYAATKAALCRFIESVNIELEHSGVANRILDVSPGSIKGTQFANGKNDLSLTACLAQDIIDKMFSKQTRFVPNPDVFDKVIADYKADEHAYGLHSIKYKLENGRLSTTPQVKIGYLSGTFDLFHIGHLNILRRAKSICDFLVVGVHKNGSHKNKPTFIPFEERVDIVRNIKYVDMVIESEPEDCDVYKKGIVEYNYLFVGSDYKGTERFNKYEEFFKDKPVEIVYFPYTQGTSSTELRNFITSNTK